MTGRNRRPPNALRSIARRIIRGPDAQFIIDDLQELLVRDIDRGIPRWRAIVRYARGILASALSVGTARSSREGFNRFSLLDWKLAFRMLVRYPGLTFVAGFAIAFSVMAGATNLEFLADVLYPQIPLDEGARIVEIRHQDIAAGRVIPPSLDDFASWKDDLGAFEKVGAFQTLRRNVITQDGTTRSLFTAAMTANAFNIARVPPLFGRLLDEADEEPGTPNVVVISHEVWQSHFEADPEVVGQRVEIASEDATIIGVMPDGFGWPQAHDLWVPLRLRALDFPKHESPSVQVVARIAPGVSLREGQAELVTVGMLASREHPATHEHLRPQVVRYGTPPVSISPALKVGGFLAQAQVFAAIMLMAWANVAFLLFARTAARRRELVVRSALGATRKRIITQLFTEALVLGGISAAVGLWGAKAASRWVERVTTVITEGTSGIQDPGLGFWFGEQLHTATVVTTLIFTVSAAALAAVLPALGTVGRDPHPSLQTSSPGKGWTAVMVAQIAITVAIVPLGMAAGIGAAWTRDLDYGFPADEYLTAELAMDGEFYSMAQDARREGRGRPSAAYQESVAVMAQRLSDETGVRSVSLASQVPGRIHAQRWIEVEGPAAAPPSARGHRTQVAAVDQNFFGSLGVPIVSGRGFDDADFAAGGDVVVVNEEFVRIVLGDRNALGRRITLVDPRAAASPSSQGANRPLEIIGVVAQIGMTPPTQELPGGDAGIYLPVRPSEAYPVHLIVHVGPGAPAFAGRVQNVAREVDPTLQVYRLQPLAESASASAVVFSTFSRVLTAFGGVALLLSLAGIFSVMSFMVTRRTREIGVRVALGATRWQITEAVFSRVAKHVVMGVVAGAVLLLMLVLLLLNSDFQVSPERHHAVALLAYLVAMPGVCMVACVGPMRRALRVEPSRALQDEL